MNVPDFVYPSCLRTKIAEHRTPKIALFEHRTETNRSEQSRNRNGTGASDPCAHPFALAVPCGRVPAGCLLLAGASGYTPACAFRVWS